MSSTTVKDKTYKISCHGQTLRTEGDTKMFLCTAFIDNLGFESVKIMTAEILTLWFGHCLID